MQYLDRSKFFNKKKKENSDLVFQSKVKKRGHGLYFPLPPYFSKECPSAYTLFLTSTLYSFFSLVSSSITWTRLSSSFFSMFVSPNLFLCSLRICCPNAEAVAA